jgi:hypothetical protein
MLMSIMLTLFFGLLFLSASNGRIENDAIKIMIEVAPVTVILGSNVIAIGMTIWDIYTSQKNIRKRAKKNKKIEALLQSEQKNEIENDGDYEFHFLWSKWNVSSSDDSKQSINDILDDLFSIKRLQKKLFLIKRKGVKVATKVGNVKAILGVEEKPSEEFLRSRANKMKSVFHEISVDDIHMPTVKRLSVFVDNRTSLNSERLSREYDDIEFISKKNSNDNLLSPSEKEPVSPPKDRLSKEYDDIVLIKKKNIEK